MPRIRMPVRRQQGAHPLVADAGVAVLLTGATVLLAYGAPRLAVVVLGAALVVASCVAGHALLCLRAYRAAAVENATRAREEQRDREQRAVLLERVHIARELHDVVAHHMSVIAVQAGLARYVLSSDPATAERALYAVAEMSSEGLAEVRRLVTVLRPDLDRGEEDDREQDTPGVDQLPVMIERVGLTGVAVEFTVTGPEQPLPAGVGLCVYRVVQESLTNAIKHARGARVTVLLHYADGEVSIRITNDGRGGPTRPAGPARARPGQPAGGGSAGGGGSPGGGKGLTGMYERAILYGGTLTAGGLPGGGFEVVLTLPIRAAPAPAVDERTPTATSLGRRAASDAPSQTGRELGARP